MIKSVDYKHSFSLSRAHGCIKMIGFYVLFQTFGQKNKHRICVHVGTGKLWRLLRVPTIYVLNNNKKKYRISSSENCQFSKSKKSQYITKVCKRNGYSECTVLVIQNLLLYTWHIVKTLIRMEFSQG